MASHKDGQSQAERHDAARLADEWANVGLCGGMFRPVRSFGAGVRRIPPPPGGEARGPRNQRCCP